MAKPHGGPGFSPQSVGAVATDDGKIYPLLLDDNGNLLVNVTNAGSGGTASEDETPFEAGVSQGTPLMAYDPTSGELLVVETSPGTRILAVDAAVTITPIESSTISAAGPQTVGTSPVTLLAANALRKRLILQNVGTTKLWILFGSGTPSASNYHIALPAGGTANDGSSPPYIDTMWLGEVQAIGSAGGGQCGAAENT